MRAVAATIVAMLAGAALVVPARASEPLVDYTNNAFYNGDRTAIFVGVGWQSQSVGLAVDGGDLVITGTPGREDDDDCTSADGTIRCDVTGVDRVYVRLEGGNDRLVAPRLPLRLVVDAGSGNDHVEGGDLNDWVLGNAGHDRLYGHGGDDLLEGGYGNDELLGGAGSDDMHGWDGTDAVNYGYMTTGVQVAICACARSGDFAGGERDVVRPGVEVVRGTAYPDSLTGDGAANTLVGGAGHDLLYGMGGDDTAPIDGGDWFFGGDGADTASFAGTPSGVVAWLDEKPNDGPANANLRADVENLVGSAFRDVLLGDDDPNVLRGGGGDDDLVGFGGDDTLVGGAGRDAYSPGPGRDRCVGDAGDVNPGDCELR